MNQDQEHLRLLSIFHYVLAGLAGLFALFPLIHLLIGLALMTGAFDAGSGDPDARVIGTFFVLFATVWIILGLIFAILIALAGRSLARHENYTFCLVMAGVSCLFMPFGTVLGVFTIIVLVRESVKQLFGATTAS